MKKVREMLLKVKRRRSAIPQAYELIFSLSVNIIISTNRPRRQSCLISGGSQSESSIFINYRRLLAADVLVKSSTCPA